jgi:hypothetical protein
MVDSHNPPPDFEDRRAGLVIFGSLAILVGLFCLLLVPLTLVAASVSGSEFGGGVDFRSAWSASMLNLLMAVAFVWLGVGSIRAHRWASEVLLSLSWIWLLSGISTLLVGMLVVPALLQESGALAGLPPTAAPLVLAVTFGLIGVVFVVLPAIFVLFYRSPHVTATCRACHPEPGRIDRCPRRILTLTVIWILTATSVLLMPAYNFVFPLFGSVLTGSAGGVGWALSLAACVTLAVGSCKRAPWAWWGGLALTFLATVSSVLTFLAHDVSEIAALMKLPEDQVSMVAALGIPSGWPVAIFSGVVWGSFFAYLLTLRGYFIQPPPEPNG